MSRYFLDESGHSGDLASTAALNFAGQPVFALACIGVIDETALVTALEELRVKYGCGEGELKSSALGSRLPLFARELTAWLVARDCPLFVELVDKRFFVIIHVVNRLLCGPYGLEEVDQASRIAIAEFLSGKAFDGVLLAYVRACQSQVLVHVAATIDLLWSTLDESDEEIARVAQVLTMYARDRVWAKGADPADFLPLADKSSTAKKVWMLPNLASLTNIYARINQSRSKGLEGVKLVHHHQLQIGNVLEDAKALLETLSDEMAMPIVPFADYRLRGRAELAFASALAEPCLQAVDILAGCAMRFARTGFPRGGRIDAALRAAFLAMLEAGDPFRATGINLVMSEAVLAKLDVPYCPAGALPIRMMG